MAYFEKGFHVSKDDTKILNLLKPRSGVVRAILDTDTYNEIDDQFALVQMMLSNERIKVEGIYAAPFSMNERADNPEKGMELSYDEILRLLERINVSHENFVFKGVKEYVGSAKKVVDAPAVDDLIKKAHEGSADNPLYVIAIGAISNVASALIKDPSIKEKIVVIWLGGNALYWPHSYDFNLKQDVGEIGKFLAMRFKEYSDDHKGWSKELWDMAAVAWLINEEWTPTNIIPSPILSDNMTWSVDHRRHSIKIVTMLNRDEIIKDFIFKLERFNKN